MAAFEKLDWSRLEVLAIGRGNGLAAVEEGQREACREWLVREGYRCYTLDCRAGLQAAVPALGLMMRWEEQFGYALSPHSRNLDALRDGFGIGGGESARCVLEVLGAEEAWREDEHWFAGLLSIASEESGREMAIGKRFFTVLVLRKDSALIGRVLDRVEIPRLFTTTAGDGVLFRD